MLIDGVSSRFSDYPTSALKIFPLIARDREMGPLICIHFMARSGLLSFSGKRFWGDFPLLETYTLGQKSVI